MQRCLVTFTISLWAWRQRMTGLIHKGGAAEPADTITSNSSNKSLSSLAYINSTRNFYCCSANFGQRQLYTTWQQSVLLLIRKRWLCCSGVQVFPIHCNIYENVLLFSRKATNDVSGSHTDIQYPILPQYCWKSALNIFVMQISQDETFTCK